MGPIQPCEECPEKQRACQVDQKRRSRKTVGWLRQGLGDGVAGGRTQQSAQSHPNRETEIERSTSRDPGRLRVRIGRQCGLGGAVQLVLTSRSVSRILIITPGSDPVAGSVRLSAPPPRKYPERPSGE
jgi:hypothetical protein